MTKPYHKNVAGPFYVVADCCLTCGIPVDGAPEVFTWDEEIKNGPCFVHRQPKTAEEFGKVIQVMKNQEANCIRYRGTDPAELQQLSQQDWGNFAIIPPSLKGHERPWWKFWNRA
jgi:hypothetical protein